VARLIWTPEARWWLREIHQFTLDLRVRDSIDIVGGALLDTGR